MAPSQRPENTQICSPGLVVNASIMVHFTDIYCNSRNTTFTSFPPCQLFYIFKVFCTLTSSKHKHNASCLELFKSSDMLLYVNKCSQVFTFFYCCPRADLPPIWQLEDTSLYVTWKLSIDYPGEAVGSKQATIVVAAFYVLAAFLQQEIRYNLPHVEM